MTRRTKRQGGQPPLSTVKEAIKTRDTQALADMGEVYGHKKLSRILQSVFKPAAGKGDLETCSFLREQNGATFQAQHFSQALRRRDQPVIDWLWANATDREKQVFCSHYHFILAVVNELGPTALRIQQERGFPAGKRYQNKTLSDYAVMTGSPRIIDFALGIFPEEAVPGLYGTALLASTRDYNGDFPRLKNPVSVIDHLRTRGVDPRPALHSVMFHASMDYKYAGTPTSHAASHLFDMIFIGVPIDKEFMVKVIKDMGANSEETIETLDVLTEMMDYQDQYVDLDALRGRTLKLKSKNPLTSKLLEFLDHIALEYFHEYDPDEDDLYLSRVVA